MQACPTSRGPQWLAENVLHGRQVLAVAGTHGKTTTTSMLAWILEDAGLEPGLPDRRRAAELRVSARLGRGDRLRHRGRRIRHRLLRQAQQVRPLPAANRRAQQPRVRPRGHLSPTSRPSRRQFHHLVRTVPAGGRARGQRARGQRCSGCSRAAAGARWCASAAARTAGALRARGEPHASMCCAAAKIARVEWHAARRAQPAQCAGGHRRRASTSACRPRPRHARWQASRTSSAEWNCAARPAA